MTATACELKSSFPFGDLIHPPSLQQTFATLPPLVSGHVPLGEPVPFAQGQAWQAAYFHAMPARDAINPWSGGPFPAFSWLNKESAIYPNADAMEEHDVHPVSVENGLLHLTAMRTPETLVPSIPVGYPHGYISGALISYPHSQTYGVFEMVAKLPAGAGLWPAFWLLAADGSWPPEADIVEVLGKSPKTVVLTSHSKTEPMNATGFEVADTSEGFHSYCLDWGPDEIVWYFDRQELRRSPTPADWHKPFYALVNLAVGGPADRWGGPPTDETVFPATMQVKSITVWQRRSYVASAL